MAFLKNLFGGKGKDNAKQAVEPVRRISAAPGQSQDEQDQNRARMEAELDAARTARSDKPTQ